MFDAKKLLEQFLGSQIPGTSGSVRDKAGQVTDLAKKNPLATGAIAAAILGTKTGRASRGQRGDRGRHRRHRRFGISCLQELQIRSGAADGRTARCEGA